MNTLTPSRPMAAPSRTVVPALPFLVAVAAGVVLPFEPRLSLLLVVFVALIARGIGGFDSLLHVLLASVFVESVTVGPLRVGRVLAIVAVGVIVLRTVTTRWRPRRLHPRIWLPTVLFVSWAWASGFWARDHGPWSFAMFQLALALCFAAAFAWFVESADQVRSLLRTYVLTAIVSAGLGVFQAFTSTKGQATGLQGDHNIFAMYQVAAIAAAIGLARTASLNARWIWRVALIVLAGSVLASASRGGLIALGVVILWSFGRRLRTFAGILSAVFVVGIGVTAVLSIPALHHRVQPSEVEQDRGSGRIDIWYVAWRSVDRHPVIGLGGGNFKSHSIELLESQPGVELVKSHLLLLPDGIEVHNVYLETLVEYGVPGAFLFALVLITTATKLRVRGRRPRWQGPADLEAAMCSALTGMLLAFASAAVFLSIVNNKLLWALVGIAAARQAQVRTAAVPSQLPRPAR